MFSLNHFLETSPLRNGGHFWQLAAREDSASRRRGFLLHTVTRLLRPRLTHYYGIICHLTPIRRLLELPLEAALPASHASPMGELTRLGMMPGFPSYCTDSLSMITSSVTCCRCPCIGHCVFLHTRPGNRPNQVRLRYVPSTSYRFLQTPPLASDALANRILFPMDGVRSLTSSDWVCQLRWANKKPRKLYRASGFVTFHSSVLRKPNPYCSPTARACKSSPRRRWF